MTVCLKKNEISVEVTGTVIVSAMLQCTPNRFAAFSCLDMLVVKIADQPTPSGQSGPDVTETRL